MESNNLVHRLRGMRCYLAGAMDRVKDGGVEWRHALTPILNNMGIIVMNPCLKPYDGAVEDGQERAKRVAAKKAGDLDAVAKIMKPIRGMDLHMVDASDFLIVSIDTQTHMCGSYEEVTLANRQKKPVLCWVQQGRNETPDWLLAMLPTQFFFSNLNDLLDYLDIVNTTPHLTNFKRWYTPHFHMLYDTNVLKLVNGNEE